MSYSEMQDRVSLSSQYMAAARAIEHRRKERLFSDPLAEKLAGQKIMSQILPQMPKYEERGKPVIAVRTRFFDDFLMSSASHIRQIVILGAGMDTRAFRLPLHHDTCLYEIDRPEVMQLKESFLISNPANCHREFIPIDIKQFCSENLIKKGFQPSSTSVWLLEGLLYYLNEADVRALFKTISDLTCQGSMLGADLINGKMRQWNNNLGSYWQKDLDETEKFFARLGQCWQSDVDEPEKFFAQLGWQSSVVQYGEESANYGRFNYTPPPREVPDIARGFLVTAIKSD
jgi:methyltransferase (TIGR00027 family)